ncbi:hypothetical protein ACFQY5_16710 [Paeniroseomonas aquatica]|uniref:hypothetical protein n=1 Tax=Paeniroseomonas aquatica TaxID=373043 RepID=UPI00360E6CD6
MQHSEHRILTTHTGSLPRPPGLTQLYARRARGEAVDAAAIDAAGREALRHIVPAQCDAGLDVINNGEQQRDSFALYLRHRLTGIGGESSRTPSPTSTPTRSSRPSSPARPAPRRRSATPPCCPPPSARSPMPTAAPSRQSATTSPPRWRPPPAATRRPS